MCAVPARTGTLVAAASWFPAADGREIGQDIDKLLRGYRAGTAVTQQQVADMPGFDRTYISMIECGHRNINDRGTLT
jgi:hypothetical protein